MRTSSRFLIWAIAILSLGGMALLSWPTDLQEDRRPGSPVPDIHRPTCAPTPPSIPRASRPIPKLAASRSEPPPSATVSASSDQDRLNRRVYTLDAHTQVRTSGPTLEGRDRGPPDRPAGRTDARGNPAAGRAVPDHHLSPGALTRQRGRLGALPGIFSSEDRLECPRLHPHPGPARPPETDGGVPGARRPPVAQVAMSRSADGRGTRFSAREGLVAAGRRLPVRSATGARRARQRLLVEVAGEVDQQPVAGVAELVAGTAVGHLGVGVVEAAVVTQVSPPCRRPGRLPPSRSRWCRCPAPCR